MGAQRYEGTARRGGQVGGPPGTVKAAVRAASSVDNRRNWGYLAEDWSVIVVAIGASVLSGNAVTYVVAVVLVGSRMRALANLLHEAAHRKLFRQRVLNDAVGRWLCGWPIAVNYGGYRRTHQRHHQKLWDEHADPDLGLYRTAGVEYGSAGHEPLRRFVVKHIVLAVLPVLTMRRLGAELRADPRRAAGLLIVSVGLVAATATVLPTVGRFVLLYWAVPWLTAYQTIAYWAELGEHGGLRGLGREWGTRNWRGGLVSRWLIGSHSDDLFHLLHHCFPSVPHYRLSEVDRICVVDWADYAAAHRCGGFFLGGRRDRSVLRDMWVGTGAALPTTSPVPYCMARESIQM